MIKSTMQKSKGGERNEVPWKRDIEQAQKDFREGNCGIKHFGSSTGEKGSTGKGSAGR